MVDFPTANHSQTPCVPWASYSTSKGHGAARHPLPDLEHLNLGSPPAAEQGSCLGQSHLFNQGFQSIKAAAAPVSDSHPQVTRSTQHICKDSQFSNKLL